MFMKYLSINTQTINPTDMLKTFQKHSIDKENPCLYSMMEWVCESNKFTAGGEEMHFDDLIQAAIFFFS